MKVKNIRIGNVVKIRNAHVTEEYEDTYISRKDNIAEYMFESVFYQHKNHAYDLNNLRRYKVIPAKNSYPDSLRRKKAVVLIDEAPELSEQETLSRKEAIKAYQKIKRN